MSNPKARLRAVLREFSDLERDDLLACLRPRKPLKQLLQDETRGHDHVVAEQGVLQCTDLRLTQVAVASERQRPHAGVHQEGHLPRERSAL